MLSFYIFFIAYIKIFLALYALYICTYGPLWGIITVKISNKSFLSKVLVISIINTPLSNTIIKRLMTQGIISKSQSFLFK